MRGKNASRVFGGILLIFALPLVYGGLQLQALGGTPYYVVCGTLLILTSGLIWIGWRLSVWVYLAQIIYTLFWAYTEVGLDLWALLPRISGPVLLGLVFLFPSIREDLAGGPSIFGKADCRTSVLGILLAQGAAVGLLLLAVSSGYGVRAKAAPMPSHARIERGLDWPAYGNTLGGDRFSPADQITPATVSRLKLAWSYRTGDVSRPEDKGAGMAFEATPIQRDQSLYFCTPHNLVISLDAETGKERWKFDPRVNTNGVTHLTCRGVAYAETLSATSCKKRILTATVDDRLLAIDAESGQICTDFGNAGAVNLSANLGTVIPGYHYTTSPPVVVGNVVVVGSLVLDNQSTDEPAGVIRGFDIVTGAMVWAWNFLSSEGIKVLKEGEIFTRNTPNVWSIISADPEMGLVFLPTGNIPPDFYGALRAPEFEKYASSVVALDANTGDVRWSYQTTHHDVWDYDVPAQPVLTMFPTPDGDVPAVVAPTKRGEIFVLDRRTGQPITEVVEKKVPTEGAVPGEVLSTTQPFSVGMPTFAPEDLTDRMMWGVTPFDQLYCRVWFKRGRYEGQFTPHSMQGSVTYPASFGVIDWGGVSIDPERRVMLVNISGLPYFNRLMPRDEADAKGVAARGTQPVSAPPNGKVQQFDRRHFVHPQMGTPYAFEQRILLSPLGLPCKGPPWGELAAVDLTTRTVLWRRPLGTTRDNAPLGVPFPTGIFNIGGSIVTRGGVAFIAATIDNYLRAFDIATGEELWKARLPAGGQASPMTYVSPANKRQYVVVAAGGASVMKTTPGDYVLAYVLDE